MDTIPDNPAPPDGQKRWSLHWMVLPLSLVTLLLFLRMPSAFLRPQFWAEDAAVLFLQARAQGWHTLFLTYPAYYILAGRLVACLTGSLPALYAPWVYCYASLAYTLLVAWFCLRARLDYLMDRRGRIALALALVLAPQNGEVLMKLIGSQWVLMPILLVLMLQEPPARPRQAVADFLGLLFVGMTGPYSVLYAPWFLVRLRKVTGGWSRYNLWLIGAAWSVAAVQFWAVWNKLAPAGPFVRDPHQWSKELGFVFPGGLFFGATVPHFLGQAFYVISPLLLLLAGWALWRGERKRLWPALALFGCGGIAYVGGLRDQAAAVLNLDPFADGGRYFYPFYLFSMWIGVIYAYNASTALRTAGRVALVMMLAASASDFTFSGDFTMTMATWPNPAWPHPHWENYAARLDAGEAVEQVPVMPDWKVDFPARQTADPQK